MKFGLILPQYGCDWSETRQIATLAEELGFDAAWLSDHFFGVDAEDPLEIWTTLSALAVSTSKIDLGSLVLCSSYRSPSLVAKMAATLDHISQGRLILGYGAGWYAQEYEAYGYEYPSILGRLEQLEEALEILVKMWTEDEPTVHGTHFQIEAARCLPKPVRQPHPPLLVGGGGERVLLKIVAQYATIWNNPGIEHGKVAHKLQVLREHCEKLGRDPGEIEISQQTIGAIAETPAAATACREALLAELGVLTDSPDLCPIGTPDEVVEVVRRNAELGVQNLIIHFGRHPDPDSLRLFAERVIPAFRD